MAVDETGASCATTVEAVFLARSPLLTIETSAGTLHTTAEHPLCLAGRGCIPAGQVRPGAQLQWVRGDQAQAADVRAVCPSDEQVWVYNLRVGAPHTFIADGFVVHNKGGGGGGFGGGGHSYSSGTHYYGSSSTQPSGLDDYAGWIIGGGVLAGALMLQLLKKVLERFDGGSNCGTDDSDDNLDTLCDPAAVAARESATHGVLEQLARQDPSMAPDGLAAVARETFVELQRCWEARAYEPMRPRMMPDLFEQHLAQINAMVKRHEVNKIEDLNVGRISLVHVRYTSKPDDRSFTALIHASARDYYIDDHDQSFLRGDKAPSTFEEFWTFQFHGGRWLLREIEQTAESHMLAEENEIEGWSAGAAVGAGPVGDAAEAGGDSGGGGVGGGGKLAQMLADLEKTDPAWGRAALRDRVRSVFTRVMMAQESGDPGGITTDDVLPDEANRLRDEIRGRQADGQGIQFRNFCIRKVELALIEPATDGQWAQVALRVSWHAQVVHLKGEQPVDPDAPLRVHVGLCSFALDDGKLKLVDMREDMTAAGV
jgi:hypothetical protein